MSPPKVPPSNELQPPPNVFYTPGTKTPRKVQWLVKDDSPHALDEKGLDPAAFQRLTQALERHRSTTPVRVHHYPPQPEPAHRVDIGEEGDNVSRFLSSMSTSQTSPAVLNDSGSSSMSESPHHVPGNFIDSAENAGLPGTNDSEGHASRQAERLVRALTRKKFFGIGSHSKVARKRSKGKKLVAERGRLVPESGESTDIEHEAGATPPPLLGGGGVLSALLSLYDQEETAPGSSASTPPRISLAEPPERPWVHPKSEHARIPSVEELQGHREHTQSHLATEVIAPPTPPDLSRTGSTEGKRQPKLSSFAPQSFLHRRRLPEARSDAGVFGPLIASTGNLSGIAAPVQSQLQPDISRPGYRLSRYSLEDKPKPASDPTLKTLSRPQTMYDSTYSLPASGTVSPESPPSPTMTDPGSYKSRWVGALRDLPYVGSVRSFGGRSGTSTPIRSVSPTLDIDSYFDLRKPTEEEKRREKKRKRKKAHIFITRHVAKIIERQEFIMKLGRAMMMFGGPSHRLQSQIKSTATVLDIELSCIYIPDVLLLSFDDTSTSTSNVKFIRQGSSLDLGKLVDAYALYTKVIYDKLYVSDATAELDLLMRRPQFYNWWKLILIGGMCSASICTVSFGGSFIDALIVFPLGALLVLIQILSVRNELYSNVFEVTVTTLFSFLAAALASTHHFCYSAIASSSVVLILPGFIVLCGSLELMSRNIVAGSVRLCYAVMYALFLGFGLAMGAKAFEEITGKRVVGSEDFVCALSHHQDGPWYQKTPSKFWAFLTVPMFSLFLSMKNQAPYNRKELPLQVGIACIGWVTNYFTGTKFVGQGDIIAAVGAFAVGIVSNLYARLFSGNAFVVMITGILFQVPSGLGTGGLLNYVSQQTAGSSTSYLSGFQTALKLISLGLVRSKPSLSSEGPDNQPPGLIFYCLVPIFLTR
ncbi:Pheromone-regulated membrane protein 10 [Hypsizygus marmoreus]|uniref:Pheromone-regulated membrane protein 10 n=1 Tax=Hypsizygus marmoreus TaxID=39966 RepID=A0A369JHF7_HYPMA|nr:Pheromone-regulated membrane protein 10 [Hypsizygus marmoreus]